MPSSPYVICLSDADRAGLELLSRRASAPYRLVMRARIVLMAAGGAANCVIAERLGTCVDTARKWRRRYWEKGLAGLADAPRPGRPRTFPAAVAAEVKAMACEMPAASGTPLARWTCPELARKAAVGGIVPAPSPSTVRRWLAGDALKPWQHWSWIFPRDPHFALKASRVLDLCQREWEGRALAAEACPYANICEQCDNFITAPEFIPQLQAQPAGVTALRDDAAGRGWHTEVARHSRVIASLHAHLYRLKRSQESDISGNNFQGRLIEVYFSVIQRKLLTPDDFEDLDELAAQILAFENHYNAAARPFDWRFTRTDLNQLLARIGRHDRYAPRPLAA